MDIAAKIKAYHGVRGEHDRERSWELCYSYFHQDGSEGIRADRDRAALHLGCYLASWGMYRNSFLLQHAYTVNLGVVDTLIHPTLAPLWVQEFGVSDNDGTLVPVIFDACDRIRSAYLPFGKATGTLVTKVVLGTVGCLPALDGYFTTGCRRYGLRVPSRVNCAFIRDILGFYCNNLPAFQAEQARIQHAHGLRYPLMKLVDMFFHQVGLELEGKAP
jgi:hypothetical protein